MLLMNRLHFCVTTMWSEQSHLRAAPGPQLTPEGPADSERPHV